MNQNDKMTVTMQRVSNPFFRLLSALAPEQSSDLLRSDPVEGTVTKAFEWASKVFPQWMGKSPIDTAQIHQYCHLAVTIPSVIDRDWMAKFNEELSDKVFLVNNQWSLADVFMFSALHKSINGMLFKDRIEFANVTRYFDLIQHHVLASTVDSPLAKVDIDLNAPYVARQPEEKKPKKNEEPSKKEVKVDKKLEKPAKEAKTEQKKETSAARKGHCDLRILAELSPSRIDLRVGYIKSVSKHPQADSLYVEEIDVGEEKPRQVVSGLVKFIPEDQLMNRHVVLVCNLKPAKMRGVESQAMVLCASNADKSVVELVIPPTGSKPGDVLWFDGHQGTVDAQLKPKEKVWETVQPHFKTTDKLECGYMDPKTQKLCYLKSEKGVCRVTSIAQGSLS